MDIIGSLVSAPMLSAVWLTLKLALVTSVILLLITLPLAWKLANWHGRSKPWVMSLFALPLVLPPTVLGFYLLIAFSPQGTLGQLWAHMTGDTLAFSFEGLVLGSIIYSFPFALQPLYSGFVQFDSRYLDVAKSLNLRPFQRMLKVVFPLCKSHIVVAWGLSFAHTIGEFGVVLMIGGNIPGETQVLSIALYNHVEALEYDKAHSLSLCLLVFSFALLAVLYRFNHYSLGKVSHSNNDGVHI